MKEVAIQWYFSYNGEPQARRQAADRKRKLHLNLAPQARSGNHTLLTQAEDLGSVKPFYILWKYSDFCGKGHGPLKRCFLREIGVNSRLLLSGLILQDNTPPISAYQPEKVMQFVWEVVSSVSGSAIKFILWLLKYTTCCYKYSPSSPIPCCCPFPLDHVPAQQ